jgi:hypothetical protein
MVCAFAIKQRETSSKASVALIEILYIEAGLYFADQIYFFFKTIQTEGVDSGEPKATGLAPLLRVEGGE